ncbi:hypothetical protein [Enterobacter sp. DE0047]|nr:hypothetical protein [Enterobacter sp. DE0047]
MQYNLKGAAVAASLLFINLTGTATAGYRFAPPKCDYLSRPFPLYLKSVASEKTSYLYNIIYVLHHDEDIFPTFAPAGSSPVIHTDNSSQIKCLNTSCYSDDYWSKPGHPGQISLYNAIANDAGYRNSHIYSISGELGPGHSASDQILWIPSRNLRLLTIEIFNKSAAGGQSGNERYTRPLLIQYQRSTDATVAGDMNGSLNYRGVATPAITFQPQSYVGSSFLPKNINMIDFAYMNITLDGQKRADSRPSGITPHAEVVSYTQAPRSSRLSPADIRTVKEYISRCSIER